MAVKSLPNEVELLEKVASGDRYAFTVLFNHYERDVFVLSKKLTQSEEHAIEAVQDIFIKIWIGKEKLKRIENFGGYLNRIIRNYSFDLLKHIGREAKSNLDLQMYSTEVEDSTSQQLDYKDALKILDEALDQLAPKQKRAYQLCHQKGLKYEEAAFEMKISTETVRGHMKLALRKIREHFRKNAVLYPVLILALHKINLLIISCLLFFLI